MRPLVTEVTYGEGVRKEENSKRKIPKGHFELFYRKGSCAGQMGLALRGMEEDGVWVCGNYPPLMTRRSR